MVGSISRDVEEAQQFVVPVEGLQVHQHGAAGVGHVGRVDAAVGAAGQVPQDPAVRVAEESVPARPPRGHRRRSPGSTWICRRRSRSPGGMPALWRMTSPCRAFQGRGDGVGAGVLPDDGVVVGAAVARVPDDRGLPLVGDADRGQVGRAGSRAAGRSASRSWRAPSPSTRVVLDPPGARKDLGVLQLVLRHLVARMIEDHEPGTGWSLPPPPPPPPPPPTAPTKSAMGATFS